MLCSNQDTVDLLLDQDTVNLLHLNSTRVGLAGPYYHVFQTGFIPSHIQNKNILNFINLRFIIL